MEIDGKVDKLGFMKKKATIVTLTSIGKDHCPTGKYGRFNINFLIACEAFARRSESNDFLL